MADQKITQLTEDTTPSASDLTKTTKDPAGTPLDRKVTLLNLVKGALSGIWTPASSSGPASFAFHEDTDNGSNKATIVAPASMAADRTLTLPDETGTFATTAYAQQKQYFDEFRRTAADITVDTAGAWGTLTGEVGGAGAGDFDLQVAASTGDVLLIGANFAWTGDGPTTAGGRMDFASIVSNSPVNYVGTRSSSPSGGAGISGFKNAGMLLDASPASETYAAGFGPGGPIPYIVQSGDISGGTVTLRPYVKVESPGRNLEASTNNPAIWLVMNLRGMAAS